MPAKIIRQPVLYFFLLLLVLVLAGCGNATPTSHPTAIATIIYAHTFTPAPTPTITATPTASITPTETLTPTSSITFTPMPTSTLDRTQEAFETYHAPTVEAEAISSQRTEEARLTLKAAFPDSCGSEYPSVSPDGNWVAENCSLGLSVSRRGGDKKIVVSRNEVSPPDFTIDYMIPLFWSQDSKYVYFSMRFCCADTDAMGWAGPLYRLDVEASKRVKIIDDNGYFNSYSFSPTGRRLVHIPGGGMPVRLHILDLKSGAEQWIEIKGFEQAGIVHWSPDGTRFVVTTQIGNFFEENRQFSLFLVSVDDLSYTRLTPLYKLHWLYATDWSADDVLTVESCSNNGQKYVCEKHFYDVKP